MQGEGPPRPFNWGHGPMLPILPSALPLLATMAAARMLTPETCRVSHPGRPPLLVHVVAVALLVWKSPGAAPSCYVSLHAIKHRGRGGLRSTTSQEVPCLTNRPRTRSEAVLSWFTMSTWTKNGHLLGESPGSRDGWQCSASRSHDSAPMPLISSGTGSIGPSAGFDLLAPLWRLGLRAMQKLGSPGTDAGLNKGLGNSTSKAVAAAPFPPCSKAQRG